MSTPNQNAATVLPTYGRIHPITSNKDTNSLSQINHSLPSQYKTTQLPANTLLNPPNVNPTSIPNPNNTTSIQNHINSNATSSPQTPTTTDKPRTKKNAGIVKDWHKMTLAEGLEVTTDLPLVPFDEYEWKIENEPVRLGPWPPRQQRRV